MKTLFTLSFACAALILPLSVAAPRQAHAQSHQFNCTERNGIERARCERHEKMFAQCGPLKGEAHFECDRAFLLANPLQCKPLASDDTRRCEAEQATFKSCEPRQGRDFMRCVRDEFKASPMGNT